MKIKRYLANDMKQACALIRQDLGPDAIIVSSKAIRRQGFLGFFKPRIIEVTAAVDDQPAEKPLVSKEVRLENIQVSEELSEMKRLLEHIVKKNDTKDIQQEEYFHQDFNPEVELKNMLAQLDLLPSVEKKLLESFSRQDLEECQTLLQLKEILSNKLLNFLLPSIKTKGNTNLLAFAGPTGVGKTTTLAKLAAHFTLDKNLKIALITIDTYRIGAVTQLKTYGDIIGVPVEAVMTPVELKKAIERYKDCDLILIDTAGRSPKNKEQIFELKNFLEMIEPVEVYLVLDMNTKNRDLIKITEEYSILDYTKLILTKADETYSLGSIINVVDTTNLPVAYVTNGQSVPNDIIPGDPERLSKLIVGEVEGC